jgi:hypothetical protein
MAERSTQSTIVLEALIGETHMRTRETVAPAVDGLELASVTLESCAAQSPHPAAALTRIGFPRHAPLVMAPTAADARAAAAAVLTGQVPARHAGIKEPATPSHPTAGMADAV